MALFKFRKGRDEPPSSAAPAQTVEAVRRRAMHRLVGAAVLVLAGVIGFPLIFDNQPRPIPVDLPIEIVDKNKVKPLVLPPATAVLVPAPAAASTPAADAAPVQAAGVEPKPEPAPAAPTPAAATTVARDPAAPVADQPPDARALDAKKARALLEAQPLADAKALVGAASASAAAAKSSATDKTAEQDKAGIAEERFVVQVGAFAEPAKVREVRRKVEAAGFKTYTQVVGTAQGDRTRVRVGPFSDKAEAGKAADKIRKLDLPAAILTL